MLRVCTATGPALVFGSAQRLSVTDAALVNGTASHALRIRRLQQHTRRPSFGADPAGPVRLCRRDASQRARLLTAYVAGFETETRIARAVDFHHYDKGWHPTATLGIFGATAAASQLFELTVQTATRARHRGFVFVGLKANFGTMTKPLRGSPRPQRRDGRDARARGYDGEPRCVRAPARLFQCLQRRQQPDADAVLRDWAEPLDIITPGIAIKSYPCCGSTHPAIDAMLDLVRAHRLTPENVAHVVSWTHPRRLAHTNRPSLRSALDAKFSVQYCLARALVDGQVVLSHFNDDAYLDARVADVMARIEAAPHPQMSSAGTAHFGAEVTVTTTDGRRLVKVVDGALDARRSSRCPGLPSRQSIAIAPAVC